MYNLVNVFDVFLPQLLTYPNPSDPLNGEAAALMMKDATLFDKQVRDYIAKYAKGSSPRLSPTDSNSSTPMTKGSDMRIMLNESNEEEEEERMEDDFKNEDLLADMEL